MEISKATPEELVVEILLRLPVESILQCKTLSKHYYSLICSYSFIDRHLHLASRHLEDQALLLHKSYFSEPDSIYSAFSLFLRSGHCKPFDWLPSVNGSDDALTFRICGVVKGIYCLVLDDDSEILGRIALFNPATREQHTLPPIPLDPQLRSSLSYRSFLNDEFVTCGFGLDVQNNELKVLITRVTQFMPGSDVNRSFYLYNVSRGKWSELEDVQVAHENDPNWKICGNGVYLHGSYHWISYVNFVLGLSILRFDMSEDKFGSLSFPKVADYEWSVAELVSLNEHLALVSSKEGHDDEKVPSFDVWVMKEYGELESWQKVYEVSLPVGVVGKFLGIVGYRFYVKEGEGLLVSYDLNSMDDERYGISDDSIESVFPYVETMVPNGS